MGDKRAAPANLSAIVRRLWDAGASVQRLDSVGDGIPELLVGYQGRNYLIAVKAEGSRLVRSEAEAGTANRTAREMTKAEALWHRNWHGQVCVVHTPARALEVIGAPAPART